MIEYLRQVFSLEDFRSRFFYTLYMLAIYRLGSHIPLPGIDTTALQDFFKSFEGTIFYLYDIFSGGTVGFKGTRKSTPYAAQLAAQKAAKKSYSGIRSSRS